MSVNGITIVAGPGSVDPGTDLHPQRSTQTPPKRIELIAIAAVGSGIAITLPAGAVHNNLTITFPAAAPRQGLYPAVAHRRHDGHWELRVSAWDGTKATVQTSDFSPNLLVWIDPNQVANTIKDAVVKFLTGRTPSPGCRGGAHTWSHLEDDEDLVHACLTTNDSQSAAERAELRLTSNRAAYVQVDIPTGADYVWMDGQSQLIRKAIGASMGVNGDRTVFLAPGAAMTIGWRKPPRGLSR